MFRTEDKALLLSHYHELQKNLRIILKDLYEALCAGLEEQCRLGHRDSIHFVMLLGLLSYDNFRDHCRRNGHSSRIDFFIKEYLNQRFRIFMERHSKPVNGDPEQRKVIYNTFLDFVWDVRFIYLALQPVPTTAP